MACVRVLDSAVIIHNYSAQNMNVKQRTFANSVLFPNVQTVTSHVRVIYEED